MSSRGRGRPPSARSRSRGKNATATAATAAAPTPARPSAQTKRAPDDTIKDKRMTKRVKREVIELSSDDEEEEDESESDDSSESSASDSSSDSDDASASTSPTPSSRSSRKRPTSRSPLTTATSSRTSLPEPLRSRRRARSAAPHKFDSPKSLASLIKPKAKTTKKKKKKQPTNSKSKKKVDGRSKKADGRSKNGRGRSKKGRGGRPKSKAEVSIEASGGRLLANGMVKLIVNGEEVVHDAKTVRALAARAAAAARGDQGLAAAAAPPAPAKLTIVDKIRQAFELDELPQRLQAEVDRMTKLNTEALESTLQLAVNEAEKKREEEKKIEEEMKNEEEEEEEKRQQSANEEEEKPAVQTTRGRVISKPKEAGAPLANYWGGPTEVKKKRAAFSWQSPEYVKRIIEKQRALHPTQSSSQSESSSITVATSAASAAASTSVRTSRRHTASSAAASSSLSAIHYSASTMDPLQPDRELNEIFQIDPALRLSWKDPAQRLRMKLEFMPTTEFDRFQGFDLPFEEFGDSMQKFQKQDVPPKFTLVTKNKLSISREFFNEAMGLNKRAPGRKKSDDDDGVNEKCNCQWREPSVAPKPGSKQAIAESAAGKSFNCGEDCHNNLLMVECTDENCNLTALGKGDQCQNRKFTKAEYFPGCVPFKTEFKGWGVHCPTSDIPPHVLIYEYLGEIIDNRMCQERMAAENERIRKLNVLEMKKRAEIRKKEYKQRQLAEEEKLKQMDKCSYLNPNLDGKDHLKQPVPRTRRNLGLPDEATTSTFKARRVQYNGMSVDDDDEPTEYMEGEGPKSSNFYFLTIADDIIIDAGQRGGIARFTNHSCNANCVIQKWNVGGQIRIGIFSNQKIPRGKELTIDYKYDRVGNVHRQACFCGEPNCAKFIGGKKKELEDANPKRKAVAKKSKEPTKIDSEDADEVCPICGDGGDVLMCDGRVCGQFCTRVYHPKCVNLKPESIPKTWICPYHFCDECGSTRPKYYCKTCSSSACERCWLDSREPDAKDAALAKAQALDDEPSTLYLAKIRRDLPNVGSNVWICCDQCQIDPICFRDYQRGEFYDSQEAVIHAAIKERREEQPNFGGSKTVQELYWLMFKQEFSPQFCYPYWQLSQGKSGTWTDGYVSRSQRDSTPEMDDEESDEAFLERERKQRMQEEGEDDEDDEDEEEKKSIEPSAIAALNAAAASYGVAPMEIDDDDDQETKPKSQPVKPAPKTRGRPAAKKTHAKKKAPTKSSSTSISNEMDSSDDDGFSVKTVDPNAIRLSRSRASTSNSTPSEPKLKKRKEPSKPITQQPSIPAAAASSSKHSTSITETNGRAHKRKSVIHIARSPSPSTTKSKPTKSTTKLPTSRHVSSPNRPAKVFAEPPPPSHPITTKKAFVVEREEKSYTRPAAAAAGISRVRAGQKRKFDDDTSDDYDETMTASSNNSEEDEMEERKESYRPIDSSDDESVRMTKRPKRESKQRHPPLTDREQREFFQAFGDYRPQPGTPDFKRFQKKLREIFPPKFLDLIEHLEELY